MITFEDINNPFSKHPPSTKVKLDGKHVGSIKGNYKDGYRYFPKGQKTGGEKFSMLQDCKASLK